MINTSLRHLSVKCSFLGTSFFAGNNIYVDKCGFKRFFSEVFRSSSIGIIKIQRSTFEKNLEHPIVIKSVFENEIKTRMVYKGDLVVSNTLFKDCYTNQLGGAIYIDYGTIKLDYVSFYNCYDPVTSCVYAYVSEFVANYICCFHCPGYQDILSNITNDVKNNTFKDCQFISCGFGPGRLGRAYLRGGLIVNHNWNVSFSGGGIGHAGWHPKYYDVRYCQVKNCSGRNAVCPSTYSTSYIQYCNFLDLFTLSEGVISYFGNNVVARYCVFMRYSGKVSYMLTTDPNHGFSMNNCYSDRAWIVDCPTSSMNVVSNGLTPVPHTYTKVCLVTLSMTVHPQSKRISHHFIFLLLCLV